MFGLSFTKLVFTILVVIVVWHGFKWVARMQENRDALAKKNSPARGKPSNKDASPSQQGVEDMTKCDVCNSFIAANSTGSCGRDDCPYTD